MLNYFWMDTPIKNADKGELVSNNKTIYDATAFEIFWRNFLAGLARTLGGIILYLILFLICGIIISQIILPKFMPLINEFINAGKILQNVGNITPNRFPLP